MNKASMKNFQGHPDFQTYADKLVGRTIVDVRYLSTKEKNAQGWFKSAPVLVLDDGSMLYPSRDDEGNDGGALFIQFADGKPGDLPTMY